MAEIKNPVTNSRIVEEYYVCKVPVQMMTSFLTTAEQAGTEFSDISTEKDVYMNHECVLKLADKSKDTVTLFSQFNPSRISVIESAANEVPDQQKLQVFSLFRTFSEDDGSARYRSSLMKNTEVNIKDNMVTFSEEVKNLDNPYTLNVRDRLYPNIEQAFSIVKQNRENQKKQVLSYARCHGIA